MWNHLQCATPYHQLYIRWYCRYCIKMRLQRLTSFHVSMLAPMKFHSNKSISQDRTCTRLIKDVDISTMTTMWHGYLSTWPNLLQKLTHFCKNISKQDILYWLTYACYNKYFQSYVTWYIINTDCYTWYTSATMC